MEKQKVAVFISIYEGTVDEVLVFKDHKHGKTYYENRLNTDYGTMEEYQKALDYGSLKTENIGIEKIVANVISNPHIRFLAVCGEDIRGHRSGSSLIALQHHGIDSNHRIIKAPGAIPYIENLDEDAIQRFRNQITIINLLGIKEKNTLDQTIQHHLLQSKKPFGQPYIALRIKPEATIGLTDKRALHSKIHISYLGKVEKRGS